MKDGTANAGLLDQRASFEWLQRHVASFGGDPNKITISVSLALKSTVEIVSEAVLRCRVRARAVARLSTISSGKEGTPHRPSRRQ